MAYDSAPNDTRWLSLNWILPFLGAFFLYFAAIPTWRSILKREPIDVFGQALTVVNGIAQFSLAAALLYDDHRAWLGIIAVLVTALYAGIASQVVRQQTIDPRALRIFTGTAAGFLLLATPYLAKGHYITLVWCAETVFLAWACTRDRFSFLRLHVVAMLFIVCVRLAEYDGLFSQHVADPNARYIPFITPESFTPLLAVLSFGAVAYFLQKVPNARFPGGLAAALGLAILAFAVNDDAYRLARYTLAPHETRHLWVLIRGGLLIFTVTAVWFAALRRAVSGSAAWIAAFALTVLLSLLSAEALIWPGSYSGMRRVLGNETGLWWLHTGTLLMSPLLLLFAFLVRQVPESTRGFKREHIQALCFGAGVVVVMLLLRREMFAVTHAPPIGDLFQASAKQAGYRLLLSISYAVLGFAVYINGIRSDSRMRIFVAYALYTFTTAKVYFFDMESQHPLYGAFAVIALGAILIVSSYFAGQHRNRYVEATT